MNWLADLVILTPTVFAAAAASAFLMSAAWAVADSRDDSPADRQFVLAAAGVSALAVLVLSWFIPSEWSLRLDSETVAMVGGGVTAVVGFVRLGGLFAAAVARESGRYDRRTKEMANDIAHELGIRPISVCHSRVVRSPLVTLGPAPTVLLPVAAREWDELTLRAVLLHELGHIKRGDLWTQLVYQLLGILMWWNPLYWVAARQNQVLREHACDDLVLSRFVDRGLYCKLLADSAAEHRTFLAIGLGSVRMAEPHSLPKRITRIARSVVPVVGMPEVSRRALKQLLVCIVVGVAVLEALVTSPSMPKDELIHARSSSYLDRPDPERPKWLP